MERRPIKPPRWRLSMRRWLPLVLALIGAGIAVAVGLTLTKRTEQGLRERAETIALADTLAVAETGAAARAVAQAGRRDVHDDLVAAAARRSLDLFLYDRRGELLGGSGFRTAVAEAATRETPRAVARARQGSRYVRTFEGGRTTLTALPVRGANAAVLVSYAVDTRFVDPMDVLRDQIVVGGLVGAALGALIGFLVAALIATRLRRIAAAAKAIEEGDFRASLMPKFGDEVGALAVAIDRMRERLHDSIGNLEFERARLRRLLERLDQGVVTVDRELKVEVANAAAARLLGVETLVEGDPLPDPWPSLPFRRFVADLFEAGSSVSIFRVAVDADRSYTISAMPASESFRTAVVVITDVSQLERTERIEREFVANAAHELRTPVTAMVAAIEVLQAGAKELPAERDRFLAILERQSSRLARLGESLLVLARAQTSQESPELAPVELCSVLKETAAELPVHEGVEVEVDCDDALAVLADRALVEQIVSNLASNAAQHTVHGRITILARPLSESSVVLEVGDTGPGISGDERERIFDRFYRGDSRDSSGFGLGLSIVRQIARVLGGAVEIVPPTTERGTTVRVTLRRAEAGATTR